MKKCIIYRIRKEGDCILNGSKENLSLSKRSFWKTTVLYCITESTEYVILSYGNVHDSSYSNFHDNSSVISVSRFLI